uniref:Macro domain-containing protein n=3 Tax=Oryza TaxID=4527 RepID=A0A0D9Z257_9ORYZ
MKKELGLNGRGRMDDKEKKIAHALSSAAERLRLRLLPSHHPKLLSHQSPSSRRLAALSHFARAREPAPIAAHALALAALIRSPMQQRSPTAASASASASSVAAAAGVGGVEPAVTLDQVPRWSDADQRLSPSSSPTAAGSDETPASSFLSFADPLIGDGAAAGAGGRGASRFPVDHEINSKICLWRGHPWNLEVDAVVNSTNENLDEAHSSPGLHAAAGPGLAEECTTLGGCRTGMAKMTNAYDLPARKVIHTVGPKYAVKYHTAAENALSHCYRSCLELLIENGLESIAMGCIYTEAKNYPREPAAHVAIRTVRRFLEKQKGKITAVVFCTTTSSDTEIYKRLLPLYFPRDKKEEEIASLKLPADVGDENGETIIDERKIRIKPLPAGSAINKSAAPAPVDIPLSDSGLTRSRNSFKLDSYLDPAFMSLIKDPDLRRKEQLEKSVQANKGFNWAKLVGFGDLGGPPLSAAEDYSLHSRHLAKANSLSLSEIAEMKIIYRGGVDSEGRPVMVVVGAHFLLRCLDLERFILYVVKEFEPLIQKPYSIVYFHSAASLQVRPDLGFMKRLQQILGRKHQRNLHAIYVLHPTLGLRTAILALQLFVDGEVWKKVIYVDRLVQLFRYVPREQLTIPDFVFQHDLEVNGGKGIIIDPRTKHVYQRPSG